MTKFAQSSPTTPFRKTFPLIPGVLLFLLIISPVRANEKLYQYALEAGLIQGIRSVEIILPDLVAVTVYPALSRCAPEPGAARAFQKPGLFSLSSATDPAYAGVHPPVDVGQESFERFNRVAKGPFQWQILWWHCYYLKLPRPLVSGNTYSLRVAGIEPPLKAAVHFDYDETQTPSKIFKINQIGYSSRAKTRYAYLGWWAGDRGAVDYSDFSRFEVIDEESDQTVLQGTIQPRALNDEAFSGEHVYEMDISSLPSGRYHIYVPGLARSESFQIGLTGLRELYYHTQRAFFHQRCGQEFRPPWTDFAKPVCHPEVWESGYLVDGPGKIQCLWKNPHNAYTPEPGEKKKSFRGGYHDAADFDTFAYHLPVTAEMLIAFEMTPQVFPDRDLNLPESGNGIPDLLDEAEWGLRFFIENQYENGAVPLGRINECDARTQNIEGDKEAPYPPFGVIPPMRNSTPTFAAVAAHYARCVRPYDPALAERYQSAAQRAFEYARERTPEQVHQEFTSPAVPLVRHAKQDSHWEPTLCWAASELYKTTGDESYHQYLRDHAKALRFYAMRPLRYWAYLTTDPGKVDPQLRQSLLGYLQSDAERGFPRQEENSYRSTAGRFQNAGWGNAQGINHNPLHLVLYYLTREQKYLDAASLNADWHVGCNPASQTFITRMGYRFPNRPEISWFLYEGGQNDMHGDFVPGLSIYGIGPAKKWYHPPVPPGRSFRDVWGNGAEVWNEFTVHQCLGPAAMTYAILYGLEH